MGAEMGEPQKPHHVVIGQSVTEEKQVLAQQMRHAMTPAEARLWERLRGSQIGINFRRQQVIDGFIVDFYCHTAALVIEVDGPVHELEYDAERDHILTSRGLTILRFTNDQITQQIGVVLFQIRQYLKEK
jgi:very-short-patch-repair endonuclease